MEIVLGALVVFCAGVFVGTLMAMRYYMALWRREHEEAGNRHWWA